MVHHLRLTRPESYSGTLTFAFAPGGELTFEDGVATVSPDTDVELVCDRYPHLEPLREDDPDPTAADPPLDPGEYSVRDLRETVSDGDFSDADLRAIHDAERNGEERTTALDILGSALDGED